MPPKHIAILGGGLTGLSSAFHLSRRFPSTAITLLEKGTRVGGWVNSSRVQVRDAKGNEASILLEAGPRTLRPNGKSVLELINLLGLQSSLLTVPRVSPAARNRFLHIPGTSGLTPIPNSLSSLLTSPLARILIPAVIGEPFHANFLPNPSKLRSLDSPQYDDQTVDAFLSSRFGPEFARIFGSALVHGIYAADSRALSMKAAFPPLWDAAKEGSGSIIRGFSRRALGFGKAKVEGAKVDEDVYEVGDVMKEMEGVSVYSFKDGMQTITSAVEAALTRTKNVKFVKGDGVISLGKDNDNGDFIINTTSDNSIRASHLVSVLPLHTLNDILQRSPTVLTLPHLTANPSSSLTVVNIVFPPSSTPIHPPGFGYLVPRPLASASDEELQNHGGVLGTVFDSCALAGQDQYPSSPSESISHPPQFTKLTMMLGGPHPFDHSPSSPSVSTDRFLSLLTKHLRPKSPLPEPVLVRVNNLIGCIPTPTVGHLERMKELKEVLKTSEVWEGRFEVIGAGVGGVSVPDCVEQGRRVGREW